MMSLVVNHRAIAIASSVNVRDAQTLLDEPRRARLARGRSTAIRTSSTSRRSFLKAAGFSFAGAVASQLQPRARRRRRCRMWPTPRVSFRAGRCSTPRRAAAAKPAAASSSRPAMDVRSRSKGIPITRCRAARRARSDRRRCSGCTTASGSRLRCGAASSSTWADVDKEITETLGRLRQDGGAVRILTPTITSPTTAALIAEFLGGFKNARHVTYDPDFGVGDPRRARAHARRPAAAALPLRSRRRHRQLRRRLSRHVDFAGGVHARLHQPAAGRRAVSRRCRYHVQIESRMSLTGSNADRRLPVGARRDRSSGDAPGGAPGPAGGAAVRRGWTRRVAVGAGARRDRGSALGGSGPQSGDLGQPGRPRPAAVQLHQSDDRRRTAPRSIWSVRRISAQGSDKDLAELRAELSRGEVQALIVAGVNPVYDLPDATTLANDLRRVPLLVSTAERIDETASLAHFVCPDHHYLESWDDAEPVAGVVSLTQPAIQPLKDTRALTREPVGLGDRAGRSRRSISFGPIGSAPCIRAPARSDPFQAFWNTTLERGVAEVAPRPVTTKPFDASRRARDSSQRRAAVERVRAGALSDDRDARRPAWPQCVAPRAAGSGDEGHLGQLRLPVARRRHAASASRTAMSCASPPRTAAAAAGAAGVRPAGPARRDRGDRAGIRTRRHGSLRPRRAAVGRGARPCRRWSASTPRRWSARWTAHVSTRAARSPWSRPGGGSSWRRRRSIIRSRRRPA